MFYSCQSHKFKLSPSHLNHPRRENIEMALATGHGSLHGLYGGLQLPELPSVSAGANVKTHAGRPDTDEMVAMGFILTFINTNLNKC